MRKKLSTFYCGFYSKAASIFSFHEISVASIQRRLLIKKIRYFVQRLSKINLLTYKSEISDRCDSLSAESAECFTKQGTNYLF